VKLGIVAVVSAAAGAALIWYGIALGMMNGPPAMFQYTKLAPISDQMGCKAVATATLNEEFDLGSLNKYGGTLRVIAERGTDTLSLRVDRSAQKLLMLSGAGVRIGTMEPDAMTIIRDDENALVAVQVTPLPSTNVIVVRIDRKTGNAVWAKVGDLLGAQIGYVHYLQCR
jgi:hypothetical protein